MTDTDFFAAKYELLVKEWEHVNEQIGRFDSLLFVIRGWAVTFTTAGLAYAYVKNDATVPFCLVLPIALVWVIDGLFKSFQNVFIERNQVVERYLSSDQFRQDFEARRLPTDILVPDTAREFGAKSWLLGQHPRVRDAIFRQSVAITYLSLLGFCLLAFLLIAVREQANVDPVTPSGVTSLLSTSSRLSVT